MDRFFIILDSIKLNQEFEVVMSIYENTMWV